MQNPLITKLLLIAGLGALLATAAYPIAMAVDAKYGQDVYLLASLNDADAVEMNQMMYDPGGMKPEEKAHAILSIYGSNPQAKLSTDRVLVFGKAKIITPKEDPSLRLLAAGSAGGEYPTQALSVLYIARSVTYGSLLAAVLLFGAFTFVRRRQQQAPVPVAA